MVDDSDGDTFNSRFTRLKEASGYSFEALSDAIFARTGMRITGSALHKYTTPGNNIDETTLGALCTYFDKSPAWFRYGIANREAQTFEIVGDLVRQLAPEPQNIVLKLLRYEFAKHPTHIVSEPGQSVGAFLDGVIRETQREPPGESEAVARDVRVDERS